MGVTAIREVPLDIVDPSAIDSLVTATESPAVSIYMPAHRAGPGIQQDPIRLKNLTAEAEAALVERGMRAPDVADLLAPVRELVDDAGFWQHQEDGLAVFRSPERFAHYRVPLSFQPLAVVEDAFFVSPLLPVMSRGERFHVLAVSENQVRLLWGSRFRVGEVDLGDDVPASLAEALWFEDPERQLQFFQAGRVGAGRMTATFFGHGGGKEDTQDRLERFYRAVDKGLQSLIPNGSPVVLAGVERMIAGYRAITRLEGVLPVGVEGNPEHATAEWLHQQAWPLVEPVFAADRGAAAEDFLAARHPVTADVDETVRMAEEGRVAAAFIPKGLPAADHRLDRAAAAIWRTKGDVWIVPPDEVPGGGPVAAVLRY